MISRVIHSTYTPDSDTEVVSIIERERRSGIMAQMPPLRLQEGQASIAAGGRFAKDRCCIWEEGKTGLHLRLIIEGIERTEAVGFYFVYLFLPLPRKVINHINRS
jgi:hypothetical protein